MPAPAPVTAADRVGGKTAQEYFLNLVGRQIIAVKFNKFGRTHDGQPAYNMQLVVTAKQGEGPEPKIIRVEVQETDSGQFGVVFQLQPHFVGVARPQRRRDAARR